MWFFWGWGNGGRVIETKDTDKRWGSSWEWVIGMKGTSKRCGSCGDGVIGCGMFDYTIFISGEYIYIYIYIRGVTVWDGVTGQMSR